MHVRDQQIFKLDGGAKAEVYTRPRCRRFFSCMVTLPDGQIAIKHDAFGAISNALVWAQYKVQEWQEAQA